VPAGAIEVIEVAGRRSSAAERMTRSDRTDDSAMPPVPVPSGSVTADR